MDTIKKRYYVYQLCYPNGRPFYIGKGTGKRITHHRFEARRTDCSCPKCQTIRKLWNEGLDYTREIVFWTDDQKEAYAKECELIALYGMENLCNRTAGGGGTRNRIVSEETRSKMRESGRRSFTEETRQKLREINTGRKASEETRRKNREANLRYFTEDVRRKVAEARRGKKLGPHSKETRRKISEALRGIPRGDRLTDEGRKRISERHKGNKYLLGRRASLATREKMSESHKTRDYSYMVGRKVSEETRRKMSESQKARDHSYKIGRTASEETRRKMSESQKKIGHRGGKGSIPYKTYALCDPDGVVYVTTSLKAFCIERGLNYHSMIRILLCKGQNPTRYSYRGWTYAPLPDND